MEEAILSSSANREQRSMSRSEYRMCNTEGRRAVAPAALAVRAVISRWVAELQTHGRGSSPQDAHRTTAALVKDELANARSLHSPLDAFPALADASQVRSA
jgi:hypothetical protein